MGRSTWELFAFARLNGGVTLRHKCCAAIWGGGFFSSEKFINEIGSSVVCTGERNTRGAIGAIQQDDVVLRKILENQQSSVGDTSMQDVRDNSLRGLRQSAESEAPALVCTHTIWSTSFFVCQCLAYLLSQTIKGHMRLLLWFLGQGI